MAVINSVSDQKLSTADSVTFLNISCPRDITSTANSLLRDGGFNTNTYNTGTITQSGNTVTGSGTTFTSAMVGGILEPLDGSFAFSPVLITAFTNGTTITVSSPRTMGTPATYQIKHGGFSVVSNLIGINSSTTIIGAPTWDSPQTFEKINFPDTNVRVGNNAGDTITSGTNNVMVGEGSDSSSATGTNRIALGAAISVTNNNQAVIGNDSLASIVNEGAGTCNLGTLAKPFATLALGASVTNAFRIFPSTYSAARVYTVPEAGADANFILSEGANQALNGGLTVNGNFRIGPNGGGNYAAVNIASLGANRTYTMPDAGGSASFIMSAATTTQVISSDLQVANFFATALIESGDGTAGAPAYSFISDTNTGIYRVGADVIGIAAGGSETVEFNNVTSVKGYFQGNPLFTTDSTPTNYTATGTIAAADIVTGLIKASPASSMTITFDTAANIYAAMGSPANVGAACRLMIVPKSGVTTIAAGTGITLDTGRTTLAPSSGCQMYFLVVTNTATPTITVFGG